ncbi:MAG: anaerobic ribonucleoside-triphosphate reductase activating protein [Thermoplasmatota archaeon]
MRIGGVQKLSLIDYPDRLSAVVWTVGCNLRCPYCYNHNLVNGSENIREEQVISVLKNRKDVLEGLSVSGGEPTIQDDLPDFLRNVKEMDFLVKLDTNGTRPKVLSYLIDDHLVDYIAMDVKAPRDMYDEVAGKKVDISSISRSLELIKSSGIPHEFRTTVVPGLLDEDAIEDISGWVGGESRHILQQFKRKMSILDPDKIDGEPYPEYMLEKWGEKYFEEFEVRF